MVSPVGTSVASVCAPCATRLTFAAEKPPPITTVSTPMAKSVILSSELLPDSWTDFRVI